VAGAGLLQLRGGFFEVIQSLADPLYQRAFEGTGGWSKEVPGYSAPTTRFFLEGSLAAQLHHHKQRKESPVTTRGKKEIYNNDCAQARTENTRSKI
jgi:hypothetical protein